MAIGRVAEWLGTGLQNPLLRFNSGRDLKESCEKAEKWHGQFWVSGGIGIHATLKMLCLNSMWVRVPPDPQRVFIERSTRISKKSEALRPRF